MSRQRGGDDLRNLSTGAYSMVVSGVTVEVRRKPIKHLYIRVDPYDGRVRVSVPVRMDEQTLQRAVASRLVWIRGRQRALAGRPDHVIATGETHYYRGLPHRLEVVEHAGRPAVRVTDAETIELQVRPGTDAAARRALLERWYRRMLAEEIPDLIAKWEPGMGVRVAEWRIKRMKTRWGTCNILDRRIWLNLWLARMPRECLEYVLVHEMVHLLERRHNARFRAYMDRFLPRWRMYRERLQHMETATGVT